MGPIIRLNSNVAKAVLEFVAAAGGPARSLRDEAGITPADLALLMVYLDRKHPISFVDSAARDES